MSTEQISTEKLDELDRELSAQRAEIASLAGALRQAEAERDEARSRLSSCQWSHEVQSNAADKAESESLSLREELGEMTFARDVALTLANNMVDERDTAWADAERLAAQVRHSDSCDGKAGYCFCGASDALSRHASAKLLAAHAAVSGKVMT